MDPNRTCFRGMSLDMSSLPLYFTAAAYASKFFAVMADIGNSHRKYVRTAQTTIRGRYVGVQRPEHSVFRRPCVSCVRACVVFVFLFQNFAVCPLVRFLITGAAGPREDTSGVRAGILGTRHLCPFGYNLH